MIGVVLWRDTNDRSAVIWCEDQGDLAFLSGRDAVLDAEAVFDIGDVVQFDLHLERNLRRVRNPRMIKEAVGAVAVEQLSPVPQAAVAELRSAEIIPFRLESAVRPQEAPLEQRPERQA